MLKVATFSLKVSSIIVWLIFLAVGSQFRSDMLLIFNIVWPCIFCRTVFVCPQPPYRDNDILGAFCLLSVVTRFARGIGQSANIWIVSSSDVVTMCIYYLVYDRSTSRLLCSLMLLQNRADETQPGRNSCLSAYTLSCRCHVRFLSR